MEQKATSFFTSKEREMYKSRKGAVPGQPKVGDKSVPNNNYHDLMMLSPSLINQVSWPTVFNFDNEVTVSVKGNFYAIAGLRGSHRYVPRMAEINA